MSGNLKDIGYYDLNTGSDITREQYESLRSSEINKKITLLEIKFNNRTITKEEFTWLSKRINLKISKTIRYKDFTKVNMYKEPPAGITNSDYGRFCKLVNKISFKTNKLSAKNNKPINDKKIQEYLGFKNNRSYNNYMKKLELNKMIGYVYIGKEKYTVVNPTYAQRDIKLNRDIYLLFKEDLDHYLTDNQKFILEIEDQEDFDIWYCL